MDVKKNLIKKVLNLESEPRFKSCFCNLVYMVLAKPFNFCKLVSPPLFIL